MQYVFFTTKIVLYSTFSYLSAQRNIVHACLFLALIIEKLGYRCCSHIDLFV